MFVQVALQFVSIAVVLPPVVPVLAVAAYLLYKVQLYYRPSSRDMQVCTAVLRCVHSLVALTQTCGATACGNHCAFALVLPLERDAAGRGEYPGVWQRSSPALCTDQHCVHRQVDGCLVHVPIV